ncbi:MAG: lysophospholipid acyltransferase family protein [Alphaproteobacteria bacterium]|nr:lysophospholipid acyltransferase family protein [Alphaproteobacteria bacterium]
MIFLRSLLFNILFTAWAFVTSVLFAPLFLISPKSAGKPWARGALWLAKTILGITHEVRGREHLTNQPVIYASKHQSAWDTIIFLVLLDAPCYVLKRELLRIPGWGWYLWRMGMIAIDRSGSASAMKQMLRDAKARISEGRTIVIFPEGTRKKPGDAPDYHPGVIALYSQLGVPTIPVALNSGLCWGKDAFFKTPGKIIISFLPPIPPGLPKKEFMETLQPQIETESSALAGL